MSHTDDDRDRRDVEPRSVVLPAVLLVATLLLFAAVAGGVYAVRGHRRAEAARFEAMVAAEQAASVQAELAARQAGKAHD